MIKAGKTYKYSFPVAEKLDRTMVRTGTYGDGNCFFHALLTAIDTVYRNQNSHYAHLKLIREFRKNLVEWLTPEIFRTLGNGEQLRLHFLSALNHLLDDAYANEDKTTIEEILHSVLSRRDIDSLIFPKTLTTKNENFYYAFCKVVDEYLRDKLQACDAEKLQTFCASAHQYFVDLFHKAHEKSLADFKEKLGRLGEFADSLQMECIARYVGYNFVFLRDKEEDAYPGLSHVVTFDDKRQCLLFLWVGEDHFEILGELESKNLINRIFEANDELIAQLRQSELSPSKSPSD